MKQQDAIDAYLRDAIATCADHITLACEQLKDTGDFSEVVQFLIEELNRAMGDE